MHCFPPDGPDRCARACCAGLAGLGRVFKGAHLKIPPDHSDIRNFSRFFYKELPFLFTTSHLSNTNKTMSLAIITGGATGIGSATVRKYASEGFDVALLDIDREASLKHCEEDHLGSVAFFETDVRNRQTVEASVASAVEKFGPPSVLFANAGIQRLSSLFELKTEDIDAVIDINLKGTLYAVAAVAPYMRDAGEGSIVLMASDQVFAGKPGSLSYGASKGGVAQLAKSLSVELSPLNIRVNAICPATVKTPLTDKIFEHLGIEKYSGDTEAAWKAEIESIPLGRIATAEEISNVVYFLTSPEASFMTGALIPVDGGFTAQ